MSETTEKKTNLMAVSEMLIRRPVSEVFEAIVNPEIIAKIWFTKSTGRLDEKKELEWTWEMYGVKAIVRVKTIDKNKSIVMEWGDKDYFTTVEWSFKSVGEDFTFISIINYGFAGNPDEIISEIRDSTNGFSLVLAALKALLEHNVILTVVADRHPQGLDK